MLAGGMSYLSKALTQVTSDNVLKANNVHACGLLSQDVRKERRRLLQSQ